MVRFFDFYSLSQLTLDMRPAGIQWPILLAFLGSAFSQPSPQIRERISKAIDAAQASNSGHVDYTAFVNPFIGTGG